MTKSLTLKLLTCAALVSASITTQAIVLANWDNNKAHKNQDVNQAKLRYRAGQVTLSMNENFKDPYIAVNGFNRAISNNNTVKIRIKNNSRNHQTGFKMMFAKDGSFAGNDIKLNIPANNAWVTRIVDFSKLANWNGKISGIRVDGPQYSNGSFSIDYIEIIRKDGKSITTSNTPVATASNTNVTIKTKTTNTSSNSTSSNSGASASSLASSSQAGSTSSTATTTTVKRNDTPKSTTSKAGFTHPGLLHTPSEIANIKKNLNRAPYKQAFAAMKKSKEASLNYKYKPFASVDCGSYNKPNIGCNDMNNDARAAYTHALMFALTNDKKHATKSKSILKGWANKYQRNTKSNSNLVVSWAAPHFVNAGELLRHYDKSWSTADQNKFKGMVKKFLPYLTKDNALVNNWIHSRIQAHMAIAIYLDDKKQFDAAVKRWKKWVPTYVYLTSDGKRPKMNNGHKVASKWKETKTYVNGMSMETCRDLHHMADLGFAAIFYSGQYAWNQGVDLFKAEKKRLTTAMEVHGAWMTGDKAIPKNMCKSGKVVARLRDKKGISKSNTSGQKVWEIGYNHLSERLNANLPYTREMILDERSKGGQGSERWVYQWETLGHAK